MARLAPNLFVLGSARCGTSSLHHILGQHPDIHASRVKEPTFFNWPFQIIRNPIEYFNLFDSPKRYRMESSTLYLSSPATPAILHGLFPDARFIISLRNPKARAYSHYLLNRRSGDEDIPSFLEALRAEPDRYASKEFLQTCRNDVWANLYCRNTLYDEQFARYFALFDRKQFHVITLAELSRDPLATTERICGFLDLDPSPAQHFNFEIKFANDINKRPYDDESDRIMSLAFDGLTARTDALVGITLDWSV